MLIFLNTNKIGHPLCTVYTYILISKIYFKQENSTFLAHLSRQDEKVTL